MLVEVLNSVTNILVALISNYILLLTFLVQNIICYGMLQVRVSGLLLSLYNINWIGNSISSGVRNLSSNNMYLWNLITNILLAMDNSGTNVLCNYVITNQ